MNCLKDESRGGRVRWQVRERDRQTSIAAQLIVSDCKLPQTTICTTHYCIWMLRANCGIAFQWPSMDMDVDSGRYHRKKFVSRFVSIDFW